MSAFVAKRSTSSITPALLAAAGEPETRPTTVGIWVVWLYTGKPVHVESTARLDVDVPVAIVPKADEAVLVAAAPLRVAGPVLGRVDLIYRYLVDKGVPVSAVHVPTLTEGAVWTTLPGGTAGLVPPLTAPPPAPRRSLLPHFGHRAARRGLVAALAPIVALCVATAAHAAPSGQPGVGPAPNPGSGQAGVTAPVARPPEYHPTNEAAPASGDLPQATEVDTPQPQQQLTPLAPAPQPTAAPPATGHNTSDRADRVSALSQMPGDAIPAEQEDDAAAPEPDLIGIGSTVLPRPGWLPPTLADRERSANELLAPHMAHALDNAGLGVSSFDPISGTGESDTGTVPDQLLTPVADALAESDDLDAMVPTSVTDAVTAVLPAVEEAIDAALVRLQAALG
ncbi:hypothetical protein [Nocardia wallacei]|uniref:hypothetical protein n=1 Tax=Nocardia wallacei TaxID=480035 RepID=UPI002455CACB|nr:hypothetical protein [Nocardia wallacei]